MSELDATLDELKAYRKQPIVVVCNTEGRSVKAAEVLRGNGFTDVRVLAGGMMAWHGTGLTGSYDLSLSVTKNK